MQPPPAGCRTPVGPPKSERPPRENDKREAPPSEPSHTGGTEGEKPPAPPSQSGNANPPDGQDSRCPRPRPPKSLHARTTCPLGIGRPAHAREEAFRIRQLTGVSPAGRSKEWGVENASAGGTLGLRAGILIFGCIAPRLAGHATGLQHWRLPALLGAAGPQSGWWWSGSHCISAGKTSAWAEAGSSRLSPPFPACSVASRPAGAFYRRSRASARSYSSPVRPLRIIRRGKFGNRGSDTTLAAIAGKLPFRAQARVESKLTCGAGDGCRRPRRGENATVTPAICEIRVWPNCSLAKSRRGGFVGSSPSSWGLGRGGYKRDYKGGIPRRPIRNRTCSQWLGRGSPSSYLGSILSRLALPRRFLVCPACLRADSRPRLFPRPIINRTDCLPPPG